MPLDVREKIPNAVRLVSWVAGFTGFVATFGTAVFLFKVSFDLAGHIHQRPVLFLALYWLLSGIASLFGTHFSDRRPVLAGIFLSAATIMQVLTGFVALFLPSAPFLFLAAVLAFLGRATPGPRPTPAG